jgi:hypothetical protein
MADAISTGDPTTRRLARHGRRIARPQRLSIIDLTPAGPPAHAIRIRPLCHHVQREIYNHAELRAGWKARVNAALAQPLRRGPANLVISAWGVRGTSALGRDVPLGSGTEAGER